MPNRLRDLAYYWVPAGLLDDVGELEVIADFHLGSKASWDHSETARHAYDDLPSVDVILALLHRGDPTE